MLIEVAAQGRVLQMKRSFTAPQQPPPRVPRGTITGFSKQSRKRLLKLTARLELGKVKTTFLTLTFSTDQTHQEAKAALKRFTMRLRRRNPDVSGLWRMEYQERGVIHFHLVLFNMPFWAQRDLQKVWEQCTKEKRSIVDIRLVHSPKQVMSYVSKYIAKEERAETAPSLDSPTYQHEGYRASTGRFWGYINQDALPYAEIVRAVVTSPQVAYYLRWFISVSSHRSSAWGGLTAFLFSDEAHAILRATLSMCGIETFPAAQSHNSVLASIFA